MAFEELQDGRYRFVRLLGSGGMGEVYLMLDVRVNRQVAIKVIRSESTPYPDSDAAKDAARLFQREARAIAALEHPNILPLYDFGEETREGQTMTYMVMPYCTEGTLASWLQLRGSSGRLPQSPPSSSPPPLLQPQDITYLVDQAADALQYAHDHEVIHLDVKPSNFLLRSNRKHPNRPTVLLADFGIARSFTTVASASLTIRGTPTSMAPEQWSSTPVPATDQYALAVMVYEVLTGRPPFVGSMEQLMYHHFTTPPPPPSTFHPRLSSAIDAVLLRALAKKPEERFPAMAAFASAFEQAVHTPSAEPATEQQPGDDSRLYATLALSPAEAESGISQMITLPGGRNLTVPIPAGAQDGQVIRVQDSNGPANQGGEVLVTVAITRPEVVHLAASAVVERLPHTESAEQRHPSHPVSSHDLPTVATSHPTGREPEREPPGPKRSPARLGMMAMIAVLLVLVLASTLYLAYSRQLSAQQANAALLAHAQTATAMAKLTPSPSATPTPHPGLYLAGTYNGSMYNQTTKQTTALSVHIVQKQGDGTLSGTVTFKSSPVGVYPLRGSDDTHGHFSFAVQLPTATTPLLFVGAVQQQVYLHGNMCNSSTNVCSAYTGFFTVGPRF